MPSPLSSVYKHKDYSGQQIVFLFLRYPVNKGRWITFSVPIQRYYIPEHPVSNPTPDYHILHYHGLFSVASQHSQSWVQTCCCLTISQFSFTHECQCVCQLAHVVYWVPVQGAPCPLPCASWDRLQPWTGYNTVSGCWKWYNSCWSVRERDSSNTTSKFLPHPSEWDSVILSDHVSHKVANLGWASWFSNFGFSEGIWHFGKFAYLSVRWADLYHRHTSKVNAVRRYCQQPFGLV